MAATEPTRKPWHSTTDALWASSAAAGDTESTPTDGEIVAGHVNGTGYTSGRANWLWAAVSEWFQKVRDVLLPQHTDSGGHTDVTVVGASGSTKLQIMSTSGEADGTRMLDVIDSDGELGAWIFRTGDFTARTVTAGNSINGLVGGEKLAVFSAPGDISTATMIIVKDSATTHTFRIQKDGSVYAAGDLEVAGDAQIDGEITTSRTVNLALSPGEFHCASDVAGSNNSSGVYYIEGAAYNGVMNAADTVTRRVMAQEHRLVDGDSITAVTLYANRTAGTITLRLKNKSGISTIQEVGSCTISSGTGDLSASFSTLPHAVSFSKGYWWEIEIANGGAAGDIKFQRIEVTLTRSKII